ncbi:hypothetical protein EJ08DRAFT_646842 [Tothia fuscella]|uniref:S-adenosylmethionine tRNA ribosyltransferase n=1 Tax=Tothia fuscella TaxID=1048955 RepID=A0A9P4NZ05_9PEZI|nr:hypothetical protein EJ08DRAFT_646842 [Tothia fuscella]
MADPLRSHLSTLLQTRAYPKTICPSEVARALSGPELNTCGVTAWRELMPTIREIVWAMRDRGEVEILQRGEALGLDIGVRDITGPIRVRKVQENSSVAV